MRVRGHLLHRVIPGTSVGIQACRIAVSVSPRFSSCLCSLSLCRDVFLCFQFLYPARYFISLSLSLSLLECVPHSLTLFPLFSISLSLSQHRDFGIAAGLCCYGSMPCCQTAYTWDLESLSLSHTRTHTCTQRLSLVLHLFFILSLHLFIPAARFSVTGH